MKQFFLFALFLITYLNQGQSKESLDFKIRYTPETIYTQLIEQSADMVIAYEGSPEFLANLEAKEIQNPTIKKTLNLTESILKTGKLKPNGTFPLTIEFVKSNNLEGTIVIPNGTIIYGNATDSSLPKLDSIVSKDMEESFKKTLLQTMQSTFSQISIPDTKIKIGETFSQKNPLSLPIAGITIDMDITTNYKLLKIEKDHAEFDITQVYIMKIINDKYNINATGTGKGNLTYNIPNQFSTHYDIEIEMGFSIKMEQFTMNLTSKSGFNHHVQISKY
ncbi:hypothetical protein GON26_13280 [Flavobacterium sp. GA093]|uniref:Uncharacterized protein n=1 Tax=Flavobacterium hydrocarbonoxydans TaxID=2683249 RepID=A0A6I4NS66_9FLAO|nr:hypothetical protein [Flavobacterium hydrocarbonoxydans]MWB95335.1 hypothetical protein [Flavobacterium hydrocarbonoxydans]